MAGEDRVRFGPVRRLFSVAEAAAFTGAKLVFGSAEAARPGAAGAARPAGAVPGTVVPGAAAASAAAAETDITGVEVDSRYIRPGDLFGALPGEKVDGFEFVGRAFDAGAVAALVGRDPGGAPPPGRFFLVVPDVLAAIMELAKSHRRRFSIPVIGVTGSVGKTTTKDLIASALGSARSVLANRGNLNTDIGLPLTIFELGPEHELACLEMGMRGPGEITRLASLAQPCSGVITNVGPVHIERLGSLEAIAKAKEELLWALPSSGSAVLNADDPVLAEMAERHRPRLAGVVTYGLGAGPGGAKPDVTAADTRLAEGGGMTFRAIVSRGAADLGAGGPDASLGAGGPGAVDLGEFSIPLSGRHSVLNALAAIATGLLYGVSPEAMREGLRAPHLSSMRQETIDVAGVRIINDAYNAGIASMRASVELLALARQKRGGRAIAILGDMLELGEMTEPAHRELGREVASAGVDLLISLGPRSEDTAAEAARAGLGPDRVRRPADASEAASLALAFARPGDTILVKASRGMAFEGIVERLLWGLREREEGAGASPSARLGPAPGGAAGGHGAAAREGGDGK